MMTQVTSDIPRSSRRFFPEKRGARLPAHFSDLERKLKARPHFNDLVEQLLAALYDKPEFAQYLDACYDQDAVEGSLSVDNVKAAEMIRDAARKQATDHPVAKAKLATIIKSLGVVLRRYGEDRKTRRNMLHGEVVPPAPEDNALSDDNDNNSGE